MIDWLTVRILGAGPQVRAGVIMSVDPDGLVEWAAPRRQPVEGSWSQKVHIRHHTVDGSLEISGNPAKWLQGHNVFGTNDLPGLAAEFVLSVCRKAGIELDEHQVRSAREGVLPLTRVDVTESWQMDTEPRAIAAVQAIGEMGHLKHRGRGSLTHEGTCYFGKHSRRISAKLYAKGLELKRHPLPAGDQFDRVLEHARGLLRIEWTLRALWLKSHPLRLDLVANWRHTDAAVLHRTLTDGLNISEAAMTEPKALESLPPRLQATYLAWLDGHDVRAMFKSKETFYRYRRALLPYGVDLAVKRPGRDSNVIPLRIVLTGRPVDVPDWAKGTPLYFEPAAA